MLENFLVSNNARIYETALISTKNPNSGMLHKNFINFRAGIL